jgi:hypothetical protein
MITVVVMVNGKPILARSAKNIGEQNENGEDKYEVDTGEIVWHKRDEGAVPLVKMMLDTIRGGH